MHEPAFQAVRWDPEGSVVLLDQRLIPFDRRHVHCRTPEEVADGIRRMVVRGAPAIGIAAAYGMALALFPGTGAGRPEEALDRAARVLVESRPTAVNLAWAVGRMSRVAASARGQPLEVLREVLVREALAIHQEDIDRNRAIGLHGASLIPDGATVLTHCNAGALATGGFGTALGVIRGAREAGKRLRVVACETRPYLQGARLTAWELLEDGFDVTLITDNAAGFLMSRGEITCAVVGADRIARNGDTANKIGTYVHAVLAARHGIPFYVAAPTSTLDPSLADGSGIPIEERGASEVTEVLGRPVAPAGVRVRNPAFDVTPGSLIAAFVTEVGVHRPGAQGYDLVALTGIEPVSQD
ncbi:S-methyl-5-thioribose-1-phosphate isomerase [Myxococcota bacterium]|nr:S-methyl-5-thioribose-1-phosphate isomerase [Myxococcota bacterium]